MKIICIAGHCCSGKTTAIGIMAKHLPNSEIARSDNFLAAALIEHRKEFEEIYKIPLDTENPYESYRRALSDDSPESVKTYIKFENILSPFLENKVEKAVEEKQQGKDFIIAEYVMLPVFKIWEYADYRIMITSNKELRAIKWRERAIIKGSYNKNDRHHYVRENALAGIIENAGNIDFLVENKYDENFERDLIHLCQKIVSDKN